MCSANLHGCAVIPHNRTYRRDAPHAAEQMAAPIFVSDLCRSSAVNSPLAGGIGVRVLPASCVLVPKRYACAFLARQEKPKTQPESHAAVSYTAYNLAFLHFEFRSRYISRYTGSTFNFLLCVVATIVAMVFLRRICSSRPGDGEQRRQSLAALTACDWGLYCFQPQRMAACLTSKQTAYLSLPCKRESSTTPFVSPFPTKWPLCGDPNYGRTLCVQTGRAA